MSLPASHPIAILADRPLPWVEEVRSRSRAHVDVFGSAWDLRKALLGEAVVSRRVFVGAIAKPSPVNVAAALVKDGRALSVMLVTEELSGSLQSRALQAGVDGVLGPREAVAACLPDDPPDPYGPMGPGPAPAPDGGGGWGPAGFDGSGPVPYRSAELDEPDGPATAPGIPAAAAGRSLEVVPGTGASDAAPKNGPRIVLVSGRGGVGKSAVCALMAATAASWGLDVALVDLDLGFGNLFGYFGLDGPADLTRLGSSEGLTELSRCGRRAANGVMLFGPCAKPEYSETVAPKVTALLDELSRRHDLVVVDGGTSWGDGVAQAVQAADRLLVCSDERAGSIGSLARVGSLAVRLGVARTRICRLINRCDPRHRDEGFLSRAAEGFQASRSIRIYEGGVDVPEVMSVGRVVDLVGFDNPFSESVASGLESLLSELGILPELEHAPKGANPRQRGPFERGAEGRWAA